MARAHADWQAAGATPLLGEYDELWFPHSRPAHRGHPPLCARRERSISSKITEMTQLTDPSYLRRQYGNSSNLDARVNLHQRYSVNQYGFHHWTFDQLHLSSDEHVLELGCGPGHLWAENRERLPAHFNLALSDFSSGMLSAARNRLSGIPAAYHVADAQHIPSPNQAFDLLIANHMLYHVPDLTQALAAIRRVLHSQGRLIAATNGQSHMQELTELLHELTHPSTQ